MELSVLDRVMLLHLMPRQGSLATMRVVQKVGNDLRFSPKEIKDWDIKSSGSQLTWGTQETKKNITFSKVATEIIVAELKGLDEKEELTAQHLDLHDRFIKLEKEEL